MSESRHALIFNRRQTQQSCSFEVVEHSLPQTVHLAARPSLSVSADARLANSRISGAIRGSGISGGGDGFFFISFTFTIDHILAPIPASSGLF